MGEAEDVDLIKRRIAEDQKIIADLNNRLDRRNSEITIIQSISNEIINSLDLEKIFERTMELLDKVFHFRHSMILLKQDSNDILEVAAIRGYEEVGIGATVPFGTGIIGMVGKKEKIMRMSGINARMKYIKAVKPDVDTVPLPMLPNVDSQLAIPLLANQRLIGVYSVESTQIHAFKAVDELILTLVGNQIATAIDNASAYQTQKELTEAYSKYVPKEFLQLMGNKSILDTCLADHAEMEMTILFADIRNFTGISEKMTPNENFEFINDYLGYITPAIEENGGFIDKYIGDAIMALFPGKAEDAIHAALGMNRRLNAFNNENRKKNIEPLKIGIGIHTGVLMVGVIGNEKRMDGTVIGDSVNIAARLENLTKQFDCDILVSGDTVEKIQDKSGFKVDHIKTTIVKGKSKETSVFQVTSQS